MWIFNGAVHWKTPETKIYTRKSELALALPLVSYVEYLTWLEVQSSCSPCFFSVRLLYLSLPFLVCLGFSVLSLHTCPLQICSPLTQTFRSRRISASRMWATHPSVSDGHHSTPQPSPATRSQWWRRARACPYLPTSSDRLLDITPSMDWSLVLTMISVWSLWPRMARANPPPSPSRPVRSMLMLKVSFTVNQMKSKMCFPPERAIYI